MNEEELKNACAERGMLSVGLPLAAYQRNLEGWLALSLSHDVPASLLILSRAFTMSEKAAISEEDEAAAMAATLSSLDENVVQVC